MTEQQNTRPSASREIAVKPLKWYENGTRSIARAPDGHYWILDCHDGQWGLIERGKNGFTVGHGNACLFTGPEDARLGADILNRKRVLANLCADTAPGNTDPTAKYDDELRKVQGGWRDMDSAPRDGTRILMFVPPYGVSCGHFDCVWDNGVERWIMHSVLNKEAQPSHWMPLPPTPTEHPTEQPSVSAGAVDALAAYQQADQDGIMVLVSRQAIEECLPALRSLAQEGE